MDRFWVIPKNARNKENAEKFINFMCRPDIALMNFEYITYSNPQQGCQRTDRRPGGPQQQDPVPGPGRPEKLRDLPVPGGRSRQLL